LISSSPPPPSHSDLHQQQQPQPPPSDASGPQHAIASAADAAAAAAEAAAAAADAIAGDSIAGVNVDSQDTADTFASAQAVMVKEIDATTAGALTAAPGGARAAVPEFILRTIDELRDSFGVGSSNEPLPASLRGGLSFEVWSQIHDANHHAYRGVKLTVLNWARQRRQHLPNGLVPCARDGCQGITRAVKYGHRHGGVLTGLRPDGMHDYVTGVERRCEHCGTSAYDYEVDVTSKLPFHLQEELSYQVSAATKGASMVMSRELAMLHQYSMTQGKETTRRRAGFEKKTINVTLFRCWIEFPRR
jgi:hypothetical protein